MDYRQLGSNGPQVSAIGLGCMGLSGMYGPNDRAEGLATIHAAIDHGVSLLDTGDFYGMGHNELLIGEAIKSARRDRICLSVKFGAQRDPAGGWVGFDGRPSSVKNYAAYSLQRLGVDYIDIYRPARVDPNVPIEETVGAVADLVKAGYVRHIGLSEMGSETIRRAASVHPIVDLQIEYSLMSRGIEAGVLKTCRALGIGITAYGVLGRGLINGKWRTDAAGKGDLRLHSPRFQGENLTRNLMLVAALASIAETKGVSVAEIAIAWVAAQGKDIVPLVGARRPEQLQNALGGLNVTLSPEDLLAIEHAVPPEAVAGERYPAPMMAQLDSERG